METMGEIYHHGVMVDNLEAAMAEFGRAMDIEWAPVREFNPLPVWTAAVGHGEQRMRVVYSRKGPIHMELIEAQAGGPYEALRGNSRSHLGVWVDDLGAEVERLLAAGWQLLLAGGDPQQRYGKLAYLMRDNESPVIELVDVSLKPVIMAWCASTD